MKNEQVAVEQGVLARNLSDYPTNQELAASAGGPVTRDTNS